MGVESGTPHQYVSSLSTCRGYTALWQGHQEHLHGDNSRESNGGCCDHICIFIYLLGRKENMDPIKHLEIRRQLRKLALSFQHVGSGIKQIFGSLVLKQCPYTQSQLTNTISSNSKLYCFTVSNIYTFTIFTATPLCTLNKNYNTCLVHDSDQLLSYYRKCFKGHSGESKKTIREKK